MESMIGVKNRLKQDIMSMRAMAQEMKAGSFQPTTATHDMLERVILHLEQELRDLNIRHPD